MSPIIYELFTAVSHACLHDSTPDGSIFQEERDRARRKLIFAIKEWLLTQGLKVAPLQGTERTDSEPAPREPQS